MRLTVTARKTAITSNNFTMSSATTCAYDFHMPFRALGQWGRSEKQRGKSDERGLVEKDPARRSSRAAFRLGSITSRCSGKEPALLPELRDTRERRKSSLLSDRSHWPRAWHRIISGMKSMSANHKQIAHSLGSFSYSTMRRQDAPVGSSG